MTTGKASRRIAVCLVAPMIILLSACSENEESSPSGGDSTAEENAGDGYSAEVAEVLDEYFAENARYELAGGGAVNPLASAASDAAERLGEIEPPPDAQLWHDDLTTAIDELSTLYQTNPALPDEGFAQEVERQATAALYAVKALELEGFDVYQTTEYEKAMGELDTREDEAIGQFQDELAAAEQAGSVNQAAAAWRRYADAVEQRAEVMSELGVPTDVEDLHTQFVAGTRALAEEWELQAHAVANGDVEPFFEQPLPREVEVQALADEADRLQLELRAQGYITTAGER